MQERQITKMFFKINAMKTLLKRIFFLLLLGGFFSSTFTSCYYDNMEDLNPKPDTTASTCDTLNVSYNKHIAPLMQTYCILSCHNTSTKSGGVALDTYDGVKSVGLNGKLYGSVIWDGSASQMPKGAVNKLNDCALAQIRKWIAANYPQ